MIKILLGHSSSTSSTLSTLSMIPNRFLFETGSGADKVRCVFPMVSSLYCPMRNSGQMTIGKTRPTLQFVKESILDCDCIFVARNFVKRFDSVDFGSISTYLLN